MISSDLPYIAGLTLLAVVLFYWMGLTFLMIAGELMRQNPDGIHEAFGIGLRKLPIAMAYSLAFMVLWTVHSFVENYQEERERLNSFASGETE